MLDVCATVAQHLLSYHRRASDPPRLLMLDELVPDPLYGAGYPRAREILEGVLAQGWQVTFYPMSASRSEIERMRSAGLDGVTFKRGDGRRALRRLLQRHVGFFDAVFVSRPATIDAYRQANRRLSGFQAAGYRIYDAEALFAPREALRRSIFNLPSTSDENAQALAAEVALLQDADAITAVSFADARLLAEKTNAQVWVIGHRMRACPTPNSFAGRSDFLFVGRLEGSRNFSPNVDSLVWFVEEVMPELDRLLGHDYRLQIAGLADVEAVSKLASDRVIFHGVVEDLTSLYDRSKVFIAPTRFAAGIPRKVHDAFSAGLPCVVTPLLAKQIGMTDGDGVLVAETTADFAARCHALYTNGDLWAATRRTALERLERDFSDRAFDRSLQQMLQAARAGRDAPQ